MTCILGGFYLLFQALKVTLKGFFELALNRSLSHFEESGRLSINMGGHLGATTRSL